MDRLHFGHLKVYDIFTIIILKWIKDENRKNKKLWDKLDRRQTIYETTGNRTMLNPARYISGKLTKIKNTPFLYVGNFLGEIFQRQTSQKYSCLGLGSGLARGARTCFSQTVQLWRVY